MVKIKTKRERIKFASDNVAGACPEVLDVILKANDGDSAPYGNDVWLRNAKHANKMGKKLSEGINLNPKIELAYPTHANEVFAKFTRTIIEHLNSKGYKMFVIFI